MAATSQEFKDCRLLFIVGFLGLPWLWFVNWLHFRKLSDPHVQVYARRSLIGSVIGLVVFVAYFSTMQLTWRSWATEMMVYAPQSRDEF
jgi:hypothetical protein